MQFLERRDRAQQVAAGDRQVVISIYRIPVQ
jgi:hypothetical protein